MSLLQAVDVIIPTCNRLAELTKTISMLINIGFQQGQIYIFDDNSDDDTSAQIIKQYSSINLFSSNRRRGVIHARNMLWSKVQGQYILSLDDDSCVLDYETLISALAILDSSEQYGIFGFQIVEGSIKPGTSEIGEHTSVTETRTFIACGCIFKKELVDRLGYYADTNLYFHGEELDCSLRAFNEGYLTVTQQCLVVHHRVDWSKRNKQLFGEYGKIWRSANGFSANLLIALKYYPYFIDLTAIMLYTIKRLVSYVLLKGHILGFCLGLIRFLYLSPLFLFNQNKMSISSFRSWIRKPML